MFWWAVYSTTAVSETTKAYDYLSLNLGENQCNFYMFHGTAKRNRASLLGCSPWFSHLGIQLEIHAASLLKRFHSSDEKEKRKT